MRTKLLENKYSQVIALLLILSLCSSTTNPYLKAESLESNLFQQIGLGILHGKTPHVDLFDNKGP